MIKGLQADVSSALIFFPLFTLSEKTLSNPLNFVLKLFELLHSGVYVYIQHKAVKLYVGPFF
jgi:hypothetical protein